MYACVHKHMSVRACLCVCSHLRSHLGVSPSWSPCVSDWPSAACAVLGVCWCVSVSLDARHVPVPLLPASLPACLGAVATVASVLRGAALPPLQADTLRLAGQAPRAALQGAERKLPPRSAGVSGGGWGVGVGLTGSRCLPVGFCFDFFKIVISGVSLLQSGTPKGVWAGL